MSALQRNTIAIKKPSVQIQLVHLLALVMPDIREMVSVVMVRKLILFSI